MTLLGLSLAAWAIIFTTVLLAVLWAQITIFHYRGAFHRIWMWEPVLYLPVVIVAGVSALIFRGLILDVYGVLLIIAFLMGLSGLYFHIQGVKRQVGGWNLDNVMVGPPFLLPLGLSIIGLIGIFAVFFGRQ